jgi:hypothetical protein
MLRVISADVFTVVGIRLVQSIIVAAPLPCNSPDARVSS